jgi:acetyltransferase-like isoleucine patch superfamily enzyme
MKALLVLGPDSSLRGVHAIALQAWPQRQVEMLAIPSTDYYRFDLSGLADFDPRQWQVCVAVNEFYINDVRRALQEEVASLGYEPASVISPRADIDPTAVLGDNLVIASGCVVGPHVTLGDHCVLRPNVVLSEDVVLGRFVTLEANVAIREGASVGDFTTVCANSSLARMTRVGAHCYLNLQRHYSGHIADMTFDSPMFESPVRVLPGADAAAGA